MLIRFNVKNFLSFSHRNDIDTKEEKSQEFSMIPGKVRNKEDHVYSNNKQDLLKFAVVYGANASGKSNLVKAISFMQETVISGKLPVGYSEKYCKTDSKNKTEPSYFEMEILLDNQCFSYSFEVILNTGTIISEWLYEILQNENEKMLFTRDTQSGICEFGGSLKDVKNLEVYAGDIKNDGEILFLSLMNQNKASFYAENKEARILEKLYLWIRDFLAINYPDRPSASVSLLGDTMGISKLSDFLFAFGTGITAIESVEISLDNMLAEFPPQTQKEIAPAIEFAAKMLKKNTSNKKEIVLLRLRNKIYTIEINQNGDTIIKITQAKVICILWKNTMNVLTKKLTKPIWKGDTVVSLFLQHCFPLMRIKKDNVAKRETQMKCDIGGFMLQKSILCLLVLVIASLLISCSAKKTATDVASNSEEIATNDYTFTIKDSTAEIASYKGDATELFIPSSIKYQEIIYPVTSIGRKAFSLCDTLTSVIIPDAITHIEGNAFLHCENLTAIVVTPNNPVYIQVDGILFTKDKKRLHIFPEKRAITSHVISDGTISVYNFTIKGGTAEIVSYKGDATELIIPSSIEQQGISHPVASIGAQAFSFYDKLTSVTIPDTITHIEGSAFSHCDNLATINVAPNNPIYTQVEGILFTKDKKRLHIFPEKKTITSYVIPDGTISIGDWAFSGSSKLESITIPDSVTSIEELAFLECYRLPFLIIPDSVTYIAKEAFLLDYHTPFLGIVVSQGSYAHNYAEENHVPYSFKEEISKTYRNTDNLRLRQGESNTTRPLFTLPKGTPVKIFAQGKEETIEGITANWVQVSVIRDTVSTEDIEVKKNTTGWFFNSNKGDTQNILQEIEETYRTTLNLRLREKEGTTGTHLFTLPNNTPVKILAQGKEETIDGITANWVQIVVSTDTLSIHGEEIKDGTVGWCFEGYLREH